MKIRNIKILFLAFSVGIILVVLLLGFSELPWFISRPFICKENIQASPVIVVLYCGYGITVRNGLDKYSLDRIQKAVQIWKKGLASYLLFTGGNADRRGTVFTGSKRMALEAIRQGVPEERITLEQNSKDTRYNAINSSIILKEKGWNNFILVTNDFHMQRTVNLFKKNGFNVYPAPVEWEEKGKWKSNWTYLRFLWYELRAMAAYLLLNDKQINAVIDFLRPD